LWVCGVRRRVGCRGAWPGALRVRRVLGCCPRGCLSGCGVRWRCAGLARRRAPFGGSCPGRVREWRTRVMRGRGTPPAEALPRPRRAELAEQGRAGRAGRGDRAARRARPPGAHRTSLPRRAPSRPPSRPSASTWPSGPRWPSRSSWPSNPRGVERCGLGGPVAEAAEAVPWPSGPRWPSRSSWPSNPRGVERCGLGGPVAEAAEAVPWPRWSRRSRWSSRVVLAEQAELAEVVERTERAEVAEVVPMPSCRGVVH